jgi:hypothetical protein
MLSFPAAIKVYLCTVPCDMRRSFDGLVRRLIFNSLNRRQHRQSGIEFTVVFSTDP